MRLAARVGELTVGDVRGAKVGHIDERHAASVVAEEEEIAGLGKVGSVCEVEVPELAHFFDAEGAVTGLIDSGIDLTEGVLIGGEAGSYGPVIDGSELAHVEG